MRIASSAVSWLFGVTPAQQDASTIIGVSGKNAFNNNAFEITQMSRAESNQRNVLDLLFSILLLQQLAKLLRTECHLINRLRLPERL